ncbi:low affinity Fe/Cu permease [Bradyrhizobium sp. USDA 4353]
MKMRIARRHVVGCRSLQRATLKRLIDRYVRNAVKRQTRPVGEPQR